MAKEQVKGKVIFERGGEPVKFSGEVETDGSGDMLLCKIAQSKNVNPATTGSTMSINNNMFNRTPVVNDVFYCLLYSTNTSKNYICICRVTAVTNTNATVGFISYKELASALPTNVVTTDTYQEITEQKKFVENEGDSNTAVGSWGVSTQVDIAGGATGSFDIVDLNNPLNGVFVQMNNANAYVQVCFGDYVTTHKSNGISISKYDPLTETTETVDLDFDTLKALKALLEN